ncbi:ABC transporter ATP-binding protein [Aquirhabdus sp.]|uniref:ABC transporter ATP-binding protein n=1 Tax=Aquirhabdus sp. TaxID=2824160 RepID=UPI00396CFAC0
MSDLLVGESSVTSAQNGKNNDALLTPDINHHPEKPVAIQVEHVTQIVKTEAGLLTVLNDISFQIPQGEQVAITGRSGSGKSTLLGLLAGLDTAASGNIRIFDFPLQNLNEDQRARVRLDYIGFVFQSFQLLPHLSALENVALPLTLARRIPAKQARELAATMLDRVGLAARKLQHPRVLSGGEQQRVAIARALVHEPKIIFADEPTGNLDGQTANDIEDLLFELNREQGTTLVVVTHDLTLARRCNRQLHLVAGHLNVGEQLHTNPSPAGILGENVGLES